MSAAASLLDCLFSYNAWANGRVLKLCDGLADGQLDEAREIGFGSLRNTLFHILAAEEVWYERWTDVPWRPFPMQAQGLSLADIAERLSQTEAARTTLMQSQAANDWQRSCGYKDSKGNSYSNPLDDLLLHVANHGIHHRAQALSFLKRFGRKAPGGIDFIFFRFAHPFVTQQPETIAAMRQFGLEVATSPGLAVNWDSRRMRRYFAYGDWANDRLLNLVEPLTDAALDRSFDMGMDTIRKTVLHIADAERWWLRNWTEGPAAFDKAPPSTTIAELRATWETIRDGRRRFLDSLDETSAQRVVTAMVGPMSVRVPVVEAAVQLSGHGTHHRAQLINMLRHSGVAAPGCDFINWVREVPA